VFGLRLEQWLDILRLIALIGGGWWALFIYRKSRRGQVKLAIEHSARVIDGYAPGKALLLVAVKLANTSSVLWRYRNAEITVFDARKLARDERVRLAPFGQADPFLPVYGVASQSTEEIAEGNTFFYFEGQEISLEPGEQVETEWAFPLEQGKLGLMAIKVWFSGLQGNYSDRQYEWATFFFVDPTEHATAGDSAPLTMELS
jgi:hypothetical protein